jgi:hypothetical protein
MLRDDRVAVLSGGPCGARPWTRVRTEIPARVAAGAAVVTVVGVAGHYPLTGNNPDDEGRSTMSISDLRHRDGCHRRVRGNQRRQPPGVVCIPRRTDWLAPWSRTGAPARMSPTNRSQELKITIVVVPPAMLCAVDARPSRQSERVVSHSLSTFRRSMPGRRWRKGATHHAPRHHCPPTSRFVAVSLCGGAGAPRRVEDAHSAGNDTDRAWSARSNRSQSLRCTPTAISLGSLVASIAAQPPGDG